MPTLAAPSTSAATAAASGGSRARGSAYRLTGWGQVPGNALRYLATSPGRILLLGMVLMVILALNGAWLYQTAAQRDRGLDTMLTRSGPLSDSAQQLYVNLSVADSSAVTAYLSGGIESPQSREHYRGALWAASQAVVDAANGLTATSSEDSLQAVRTLNAHLPVYAGLVETARTNNRAGNPVASAYITDASALMHSTLLPAASTLYASTVEDLQQQQDVLRNPNYAPAVMALFSVLALIGAQLWLYRRTNRRINVGLFLATVALIIAVVGGTVGMAMYINTSALGAQRGSEPMHELVSARILAQQTRSQETLALIRREDPLIVQEQLADQHAALRRTVTAYQAGTPTAAGHQHADAALVALDEWEQAQLRVVTLQSQGKYDEAVALSAGPAPEDVPATFERVDRALTLAIADSREQFHSAVTRARVVSATVTQILFLIGIVTAAGVFFGLRPRLQEYR